VSYRRIWRKPAASSRPGGSDGRAAAFPSPCGTWPSAWRANMASRTVTALGLDYYSLKKHVEAAGQQPPSPRPAFVELPAPLVVSKQAHFELDNGAGSTLRVQLVGYEVADLEVLARCFGNAR